MSGRSSSTSSSRSRRSTTNNSASCSNSSSATTTTAATSSSKTTKSYVSFSHTAPKFSDDDCLVENSNLTRREVLEIERDVRGRENINSDEFAPVEETPEMRRNGAIYLSEGLDMIDAGDKVCYEEARLACPHLVLIKETNPIHFLRSYQYNPWVSIMMKIFKFLKF